MVFQVAAAAAVEMPKTRESLQAPSRASTHGRAPNRVLTGVLLDHLVRGGQQRFRDGEAEGLGGLEVDHQFEF